MPDRCCNCDRELCPGEAIRCDPCVRDWLLEADALTAAAGEPTEGPKSEVTRQSTRADAGTLPWHPS